MAGPTYWYDPYYDYSPAQTSAPASWTTPVTLATTPQAASAASATNTYGGGELAQLLDSLYSGQEQLGYNYASLAQQAELQRESMAMQKAIAEMQNAYDWARLRFETEAEARQYALQVAQAELQRQLSTGWVNSSPITAASLQGSTTDPLMAIWNNRSDLAPFYDANWGAGSYSPQQAVQDWLGMTTEDAVQAANRDAATYAQGQGWWTPASAQQAAQSWQPTLDWQNLAGWAYGPNGEMTPTLAREQFYASLTGPRDYFAYQRALRGDYGDAATFPWATALTGGSNLAEFQAPSGQLPGWWNGATESAGAVQAPNILPHQVNIAQWNKLLPSEQQMALGAAEEHGWNADDWLEQMRRAAPTGQAGGQTWWQ
jgi:hypothetical protein